MKLFAPVLIAIVALAANVTAATEPAPLPLSCFDSSVVSDLPMQNCADSQCDAGVFPEMVVWESVPASESIVFEAPSESMEMVACTFPRTASREIVRALVSVNSVTRNW